ncbi:MAG: hypothetical protein UR98_C0022G0019 [Parcubacteria group bacterium GW2011_GWA1_36_12]|nr:MAG: hypothetical protein UR98_C0022G0019 [Parcubacteria group bacterium GW2011_GWA1_36_12]
MSNGNGKVKLSAAERRRKKRHEASGSDRAEVIIREIIQTAEAHNGNGHKHKVQSHYASNNRSSLKACQFGI